MKNGILCINKPQGFTSFDVIGKLRGILKMRRLGHAGTLDPMATGVLPVFVGTATKACSILPDTDKTYIAGFKLGLMSDTLDITGKIVAEITPSADRERVEEVLKPLRGDIIQTPPMYSAVSVNGKRLYELARMGIKVERPKREVTVYELRLEEFSEETFEGKLFISCGKGTYVRSIIEDMGYKLGCGAIMTSLVRCTSSGITLDQCHTFEEVEKAVANNTIDDMIIPVENIFKFLPVLHLNEAQTGMYKNGVKLDLDKVYNTDKGDRFSVYGYDGEFIGTAKKDTENNLLKIEKNFF